MRNALFYILAIAFLIGCNRPTAQFQTEKSDYTAPVTIEFENTSENADSFLWDFGDEEQSNEARPSHHYYQSGNYKVTLTAFNEGKKHTSTQLIQIDAPLDCLVEVVTPEGIIVLRLHDKTMKHQQNFLKLAKENYYDSLLFHRVIPGFMIQGGDPNSKDATKGQPLGSGGPGYKIPAEIEPEFRHLKGAVAAARTNNPEKESSGSQFYIVDGKNVTESELKQIELRNNITYTPEQIQEYTEKGGAPFLDGEYTVFGEVVEGIDVVSRIAEAQKDRRNRPKEDIWMVVRVVE